MGILNAAHYQAQLNVTKGKEWKG